VSFVNVRSKPLLAVKYESQVYTAIWSEQLSREEKELKREKSLNTRVTVSPAGRVKESRDSSLSSARRRATPLVRPTP
jgi:hypothetical protein